MSPSGVIVHDLPLHLSGNWHPNNNVVYQHIIRVIRLDVLKGHLAVKGNDSTCYAGGFLPAGNVYNDILFIETRLDKFFQGNSNVFHKSIEVFKMDRCWMFVNYDLRTVMIDEPLGMVDGSKGAIHTTGV